MRSKRKINKEEAKEIIKKCFSIADFCRAVGWVPMGGNYRMVHQYIDDYELDISHFKKGNRKFLKGGLTKEMTAEEYAKKKNARSSTLLKKILKEGIKERKCECCGGTEWNGENIPLELHHIDGNHANNEFKNLKLLCPNCHYFTDNYKGRKNSKYCVEIKDENGIKHYQIRGRFCKKCGKKITRYSMSGLCKGCSNRERGTSKITTKEDFIKTFLKYKTFSAVAKEYDCCDKNIAKWAKKFGLPSKSKEMKKYLQELETKMGS